MLGDLRVRESKQKKVYRFQTQEEHNQVVTQLRRELGKDFDKLMRDKRMSHNYAEIFYYIPDDYDCSENCKFNRWGDCEEHHEKPKEYLAHGYVRIEPRLDYVNKALI